MAEVAGTDDVTLSRPRRSTRMTMKRKAVMENGDQNSKKRRTFDDFFMFCNFVLEYEEQLASAECHNRPGVNSNKPGANCKGESSVSTTPTSSESSSVGSEGTGSDAGDRDNGGSSDNDSSTESNNEQLEYTSDDDSWNLVTCFCHRPFAGRPMIECSKCQTWVHLYCAKIKKEHVPDTYFCPKCSVETPRS